VAEIDELGVRLLLDDFGTGYSSLLFLRDLPLDVVKLDRSFFDDLDRPVVRTIVSATVEMAHALGLKIVAEGIETQSALAAVRELGCDAVQGFVKHPPVAAEQFVLIRQQNLAPPGESPVV
jgi:EAL domain-containing protein (putative c-di-GMP-specific phosphodiesterase class I)